MKRKSFALFFMVAGLVMIFFAGKALLRQQTITRNYVATQGVLTDSRLVHDDTGTRSRSRRGSVPMSPNRRFIYTYTVNGKKYTVATDYVTGLKAVHGTTKTILYDPAHPEVAVIKGFNGVWVFVLVGASFVIFALLFWFGARDHMLYLFITYMGGVPLYIMISLYDSLWDVIKNCHIFFVLACFFLLIGLYNLIPYLVSRLISGSSHRRPATDLDPNLIPERRRDRQTVNRD